MNAPFPPGKGPGFATLCRGFLASVVCAGAVDAAAPARAADAGGEVLAVALSPDAAQPLAANARRVRETLDFLGTPLPPNVRLALATAGAASDIAGLQRALDPAVLFVVTVNPESRVKVQRGPGPARLQQSGFRPVLVKVLNQSGVPHELRVTSPQGGQVYAGMTPLSAVRLQRESLKETVVTAAQTNRFLAVELHTQPPMTPRLSGLEVEYAIALVYSRDAGRREAVVGFEVGAGTQDIGFRGEVPVLFDVVPAREVRLRIRDVDGAPTAARLTFRDAAGHVHPPPAKRLAPDFYFQEQVYRRDGETVRLPPGRLEVEYGRGPEYRTRRRTIDTGIPGALELDLRLERWVEPAAHGFYSGDHHIHGAGCAHYTSPTEGVEPEDMFRQIEGEGLNVGCVLTWGPCFDYQRRFFSPGISVLSRPGTLMKYDLEISGFGSESMGHVCLLNLRDQTYPGSDGTKTRGWPKWTLPVMRWAKAQGGVTGYAHSGSGLEIRPKNAAERIFEAFDADTNHVLTPREAVGALLPDVFEAIDADHDGVMAPAELEAAIDRAAVRLPNLAVPDMNGVGAMEIGVTTALGACDFISAMDTPRIAEWNMWYHLLNCGFPLKASGETDFPCMSGDRVGQGRVYVQLGREALKSGPLEFGAWCTALAAGRSYVSDGFAHALEFTVGGKAPGFGDVRLKAPGTVVVKARVAFAAEQPLSIAQGGRTTPELERWVGDTVTAHGPIPRETVRGGMRRVEIVFNGVVRASREIPADGASHAVEFELGVDRSGWVALRQFPQLHTNPVNVLVGDRPIRASKASARWCAETIRQLWRTRERSLPELERAEARASYDEALAIYARREAEAPE